MVKKATKENKVKQNLRKLIGNRLFIEARGGVELTAENVLY